MATPVIMPRQGQTVESCIITQWHKSVGEKVSTGDKLFSYETDKAAFDEVSPADGTILARFFEEGDDVPVLTNVCVIGEQGEDVSGFAPEGAKDLSAVQDAKTAPSQHTESQEPEALSLESGLGSSETPKSHEGEGRDGSTRISPRARLLAKRAGVDYSSATPSGPRGRIIERDIEGLISSQSQIPAIGQQEQLAVHLTEDQRESAHADYEEVKLSNMRKRIAEAMHMSLSTTAQLTIHSSFDASDILEYRKRLKASTVSELKGITITDMVLFAVSRTLLNHRSLNAHLIDDRMLLFNVVNLGLAVDTERGLMVPTIFNANLKSLAQISTEAKRLADSCRASSISPDNLQGGTFTVTNLGGLGVEYFTPVLNPPQTAILGVNTVVQRIRDTGQGISAYPAMGLSLTIDHRAVDGAPAARFLQELKDNLESFSLLLAR